MIMRSENENRDDERRSPDEVCSLVYFSFVCTSLPSLLRGQPIQNGADRVCSGFSTLILRSLNFQKPLPLKKYVFPKKKIEI